MVHGLVAHLGDHVAWADAGIGGRAVLQHAGDDDAGVGLYAKGFGQLGRQVVGLYPIQPRVTLPSRTMLSSTFLAGATGMAKPMPMLPPERE